MVRETVDALVSDVHLPGAVAGLRGLGRAGHKVLALGDRWSAAGLWSRYTAVRAVGPTAECDLSAFAATISRLATKHGPFFVYPGWEPAITALLDSPSLRSKALLPYPGTDLAALRALRDKRELGKLASYAGLRVPTTLACGTARELSSSSVQRPCVVKPALSGSEFSTARVVSSDEALKRLLGELDPSTELLVQEPLRGPLLMVALVLGCDRRPVARFQQIARRTWPAAAGGSSLAVSTPPDRHLVQAATRMLVSVGFSGLAQLDFIVSQDGPRLIDVNPRYYASLPLALACGVNLPAVWHAVAVGQHVPPQRPYPSGVSFRWFEADLRAAVSGSPAVLARRVERPRVGAMWAWDDPLPSLLLAERATHGRLRSRVLRLVTPSRAREPQDGQESDRLSGPTLRGDQ